MAEARITQEDWRAASCMHAEGRTLLRAGYMGHITALANKLSAMADKRSGVAAALEASAEWAQWRASVLQPRNEREDVNRWACGRPSTQEMASRAASAEDPMLEVSPPLRAACTGTSCFLSCIRPACFTSLQVP